VKRRVLITNDDGIDSPGLHALAKMAYDNGFEVVVAAPMAEASGSSAGIIATQSDGRVVVEARKLPALPEVKSYAVAATPGYIALIASRGAFGEPFQLVLSGVNHGANFGYAVIHSGTVGAALTAVTYGTPAVAVSLDVGLHAKGDLHWTTAADIAVTILDEAMNAPPRVAINVNVPNVTREMVLGVKRGRLAAFGAVQTNLEVGDGFVRTTIAGHSDDLVPGTDAALLADGYASVTPLKAVTEASELL
jgi:5'-nucleotidase